jgi:hypothetical protein
MNVIRAMRFDAHGRDTSETEIAVNRISSVVYLHVGKTAVRIPLEDWLELVRPTVTHGELRPPVQAGGGA